MAVLPKKATLNERQRRLLEFLKEQFRDRAVHLLMPPLQPLASRLFQAGVLNFARHFREQAGEPFVPHSAVGLLTLVNDLSDPQTVGFDAAYGAKTAEELAALIERLSSAVRDENSWSYAVPITYRLVFSDKGVASDITVTKLAHDALDARTIAVIEKPRERKHTHPYLPRRAVTEIGKRLEADLSTSQLAQHLGVRAGAAAAFNTFDFEAVQFVERWRTANNEFHHHDDEIHRRWFSQRAIDVAVEKICKDAEYLKRARGQPERIEESVIARLGEHGARGRCTRTGIAGRSKAEMTEMFLPLTPAIAFRRGGQRFDAGSPSSEAEKCTKFVCAVVRRPSARGQSSCQS